MASTIARVRDRLHATEITEAEAHFLLGVLIGMSPTRVDRALDYLEEHRTAEARRAAGGEG